VQVLINLLASGAVAYYPSQRNIADAILANAGSQPEIRACFLRARPKLRRLAKSMRIDDELFIQGRFAKDVFTTLCMRFDTVPSTTAKQQGHGLSEYQEPPDRGEPAIYDGPYGPSGLSRGDFTPRGNHHHPPQARTFMSGLAGVGGLGNRMAGVLPAIFHGSMLHA